MGQTWRIWNIFGVRLNVGRDEDVFNLLEGTKAVQSRAWFESCGNDDPLLAVNERFAHQLRYPWCRREEGKDVVPCNLFNTHK